MRTTARILLGLVIAFCGTTQRAGADRAAAVRIIDQAIKAHGGNDSIARLKLLQRTAAGKMFLFGKERLFSSDSVWSMPGQFRDVAALAGDDGGKIPVILVINGKQAWRQVAGQTQELTGESLRDVQEELHVLRAATLAPLKENDFTLDTMPEAKVDGRAAQVVKASAKGYPDCLLYFDKSNGLLLKIERKSKSLGSELTKALQFSDHKPYEGVVLPTKIVETLNGNKMVELTVTRYRFPRVIEGKPFEKP